MNISEIIREIGDLGRIADERWEAHHRPDEFEGLSQIDFLTSEERARMHDLKMALPTMFEERERAKMRISEKIRKRRDARNSSL